jgi:hypothetical protein
MYVGFPYLAFFYSRLCIYVPLPEPHQIHGVTGFRPSSLLVLVLRLKIGSAGRRSSGRV